ncbi:serine/threonine/tyrosine-interacting-like protein 1 [Menidia menidia]
MATITLCEPLELYNLLNQFRSVPRLAEINYLCLIDARETQDYRTSHIITAKTVKTDSDGKFHLPEVVEVNTMQYVVVYDSKTSSLDEPGRAVDCANVLAKASLSPVHLVKGGFQRFSALYPFLRTAKILYTITDLENLKIYPVETITGLLYMGDQKQSMDTSILKDLKISAVVTISHLPQTDSLESMGINHLNIALSDSLESDLYSSFQKICSFIGSHVRARSRVLISSRQGRSRCSAVTIAFLMHNFKYTLETSWKYMLKCKPTMMPNRGFMQQLSDWELHILGRKRTDLSKWSY